MKTLKQLLFLVVLSFALTSCFDIDDFYDEEAKDKVEQVTLYVASETGTFCDFMGRTQVGIKYKEKGDAEWSCDYITSISGFAYERNYEYELLVEKTVLANPPADGGNVEYKLISIISKSEVVI